MSRNKKVMWYFVLAMVLGYVALVLSPGCTSRDITVLSNTGNIASSNRPAPRQLPRPMTTRDLVNRGRR